jgi:glucuronoarabinoxylan endo-1,4-beta-xylanase
VAVLVGSSHAGLIVTQNVAPGATSWPGSPNIATVSNPAAQATVGETFTSGGGTTNHSETFTVSSDLTLSGIDIYAGSGTNGIITLGLYDLGTGWTAPNPSSYTASANLFGSGSGLSFAYTSQSLGVLQFDFTGADQVALQAGHMYAFEVTGTLNTQPMYWYRSTNDTYSGGAAYRSRSWINGNSARDFSLAIYGSATNGLSNATATAQCILDWSNVCQVIDGFGASSAWRSTWSAALADMLFSTNSGTGTALDGSTYSYTGAGLSLLRTRIAPGGTTVEQTIMQLAQARGARVWSAPWSPAAQFKSNGNINGGSFVGNATNYQAYAGQVAGYVVNMQSQYGVNLYALSIQNEPDAFVTNYESCNWTAQQIHDFIPYLSSALTASNVGATKILLPESENWTDPQGLALTAMNDGAVAPLVSIIANHDYVADNAVGDQTTPAAINSYGKALWETEVAKLMGSDSSITDGLYWAGRVHLYLTSAQANAWHFWWLCAGTSTSNEGLCDTNDVPAKRLYTVGNFSRFVRPGYYRFGVTNNTGPLQISAYKNLTNGSFAVIAINSTTTDIVQTFNLSGFAVTSLVTPWLTSASASLAAQTAFVASGAAFTNTIAAQSVVTLTGQAASGATLTLVAMSNITMSAGVTLNLTNVASDTGIPAGSLVFSLLNGPANATLSSSGGVFTWRPLVSQADTTNSVIVEVTYNGAPSSSATNSFTVIVNPLSQPIVSSVNFSAAQIMLVVSGAQGPDYTLLTSTNLSDWQMLATTNSPSTPVTFVDTNHFAVPARFYRIQLGP